MTTRLVIDASVVLKWVLPETHREQALLLHKKREHDASITWLFPNIVLTEVANGLWKRVKTGELSPIEAKKFYDDIRVRHVARTVDAADLMHSAFDIAGMIRHNAIYDCIYLALAVLHDAVFITADKIFYEKIMQTDYKKHIQFIANIA